MAFSLFERTTRKIALTTSGRAFLPSALAVQRQLTLAAETAQDIRGQSTEIVRIAAPIAVASILLPPMIAVHQTKHPRSKIRIVDTPVEWLVDRVIHGEADLALGPDRPDAAETTRTPVLGKPLCDLVRARPPVGTAQILALEGPGGDGHFRRRPRP